MGQSPLRLQRDVLRNGCFQAALRIRVLEGKPPLRQERQQVPRRYGPVRAHHFRERSTAKELAASLYQESQRTERRRCHRGSQNGIAGGKEVIESASLPPCSSKEE